MNPLKTFFYSLRRSLFEPKYYSDVSRANFWFSFKYLWFLIFILTFIKTLTFVGLYLKNRPAIQPEVNKIMVYAGNFYPRELKVQIKNGRLSTNVKEPYVFDLEKENIQQGQKHFLIIDTMGSIENYPNYNTYILATKNAAVYPSKSSNNRIEQTSVFYFKDLKQDFTLDKKTYDNMLKVVRPYATKVNFFVDWIMLSLSPLFLFFGSLFWTSGILIRLLFLTFFVWIINLVFKKGYGYGSLYKMGMHGVTWPILLNEFFGYIKSPFPRFFSWIFLAWMLIILFQRTPSKKRA